MTDDQEVGEFLKSITIQNQWLMAKIIDIHKGNDGHVQTIKLHVGNYRFTENGSKYFVCLIQKIQLLFKNDEARFSNGETDNLTHFMPLVSFCSP